MQEGTKNRLENKGIDNIIVLHKEGDNNTSIYDTVDSTKEKIILALVEMKGDLAKLSFRKPFENISEVQSLILWLRDKGIKFLAAKEDGKIIHDLNEFIGLDTFMLQPDTAYQITEELAEFHNARLVNI